MTIARMYLAIAGGDMDGALRLLREFLSTVPYCDNTNYEGHYSNCSTSSFPCLGCMSMWKCVSRTFFPQWIASGEGRDQF